MAPILHWFRRDLRLGDNRALMAAAHDSGGVVLPVFILDDALLYGRFASPARNAWLLASLQVLEAELRARGMPLIVRRGNPHEVLPSLVRQSGAQAVYWNRDYTPYAVQRDTELKALLRDAGVAARSFKDVVIFECNEVVTQEGKPYTVYTPYAPRWRQLLAESPVQTWPVPHLVVPEVLPAQEPLPTLEAFGQLPHALPPAGEAAAQELLSRFVQLKRDAAIATYAEQRNFPGVAGTLRLSPYLRLGLVSPRQCLAAALTLREEVQSAEAMAGIDAWVGELIWRDFYIQVLFHHPYVLQGAFRPVYDALEWENDQELFVAWQEGQTGYPIVDAAMRQLRQEGWMHNRARMIVASFLTKDLLIDWRQGERHFMHLLLDGDPAANNGGWQWAAGTGTDAQPYFRIFNPVSQGKKFDPEGDYVKRYIPELANVPKKWIHEPHRMAPAEQIRADVQIGRDYPAPIVDHKIQRERALALYGAIRAKD